MAEIDIDSLRNDALFLMSQSQDCVKKAIQSKSFLKLFKDDEVSLRIAQEFIKWQQKNGSNPSPRKIGQLLAAEPIGATLQVRLSQIESRQSDADKPTENEFQHIVEEMKVAWIKSEMNQGLLNYADYKLENINSLEKVSEILKKFGNNFLKIGDAVMSEDEGDYSFTTGNIDKNIEGVISKDLSAEKRFRIGHEPFDIATKGVRYGEVLMVLGNINSGKSMVLTNVVYNLWRSGANVLLLTAEMQPGEFDERIYSRATSVDYSSIINGKGSLQPEDEAALNAFKAEAKLVPNQIVTKFLKASDNVATVAGYIEDLELRNGFVPDVVVVDSLECISALGNASEDKDNLKVAQIITEFKDFAQTFKNNRGIVVVSTHQAKTDTFDKEWEDISITDFGRSKVAAEKPDFAIYIRSKLDTSDLFVKLIKGRRIAAGTSWKMGIDFSKCMVQDTDNSKGALLGE